MNKQLRKKERKKIKTKKSRYIKKGKSIERKKERKDRKEKYLDLARELKKLWNMKVAIIPIVIGSLCTVSKGLIKRVEDLEIRERVEISKLLYYLDRTEY